MGENVTAALLYVMLERVEKRQYVGKCDGS
jgi:hypothetical protein